MWQMPLEPRVPGAFAVSDGFFLILIESGRRVRYNRVISY